MNEPLVYIIILNWNGWKDTAACCESCRKLACSNVRIVLVDNGSTDNSESILRERFPEVEHIQTGDNLGFAGGNNVGIRHAIERGADYVWLLNNDTLVDPAALSRLVDTAEKNRRAGMVGSKILYHDKPSLIWYAGAVLDPERPHRLHHIGLRETDNRQYDDACETGYVTGCSLLARREMVEEIGLLDEGLFLYFEDSDWSVRAKKAGWKIMYAPESVVYHKISSSIGGEDSPVMLYYTARNLLCFIKRNYPGKLLRTFFYALFEHVLVNMKKRRFSAAGAAFQGICDFMAGKSGRYFRKAG